MTNNTPAPADTVNATSLFAYAVSRGDAATEMEGKVSTLRFHMVAAFSIARVAAVNGWGGDDALAVSKADEEFEAWNKAQAYAKGYASKVRKARKLLAVALEKRHATLADMLQGETDAANTVALYLARLSVDGIVNMDNIVTVYGDAPKPKADKETATASGDGEQVHNVNPDASKDNHAGTEKTALDRVLEAIKAYGDDLSADDINSAIIALTQCKASDIIDVTTDNGDDLPAIAA